MLKFFSASNGIVNSEKAFNSCFDNALQDCDNKTCDLIVIHATMGHDMAKVLSTAKERCPNAQIVGCSCAGVIGIEGANENMKALAIMIVQADNPSDIIVCVRDGLSSSNSHEIGSQMAQNLYEQNDSINMVQLYASGFDIACNQLLSGIGEILGPQVPVFGGTSSDNMKAITSYQYHDTTIYESAAIMIGYADRSIDVVMGVHHGSVPLAEGFTVTKSEGNQIMELNNQPAWAFLMDQLDLPHDTHPGPCIPIAGLAEAIDSEHYEEYINKHILRVILTVDYNDSSFYLPVDCQEGTKLWLSQRDEDLIFEGLEAMLSRLQVKLEGREVLGVFHTDCAARGRALLNQINKEEIIQSMQSAVSSHGNTPWLGMYGYGEFTVLGGQNRFHNYTSSIYAIVKK